MLTNHLLAFGVLVACAVLLGCLGDSLRLPRVTSYLVSGMIVGPSVLHLIDPKVLHHFMPVADLAMALVLFNLGSHFSLSLLAKMRAHIVPVAIGELTLTAACVAIGLLLFGVNPTAALMLGCLAMATAPATTVLVLKELRSEGPVTESAQALVAINNLVTIIAFELLMLAFFAFGGDDSGSAISHILSISWTVFGSILWGVLLGLILSFAAGFLTTMHWIAVLLAVSMAGLGLCEITPMTYMLTFLTMGFTFANTSQDSTQDLAESGKFTTLLCVAFFAIHGAELQLDQFFHLGAIGAVYVLLRAAGKYLGVRFAAHWSHESREIRDWLGAAMLSQAGAAIALAAAAVSQDRTTFEPVQTVILGSVIVFEILGPLLLRAAVINSGEVPIAHVARHSDLSFTDQLLGMWWKLKSSFGGDPMPSVEAQEMKVSSLVRSRVPGIPQGALFDQIISHIEHSHDNTFPVVNSENQVVGIIRYPMLSESLFDPSVASLVCAEDIATRVERVAYPDESADVLFDFFQSSNDDVIPVVSHDELEQMVGVVRRADLRTLLIRKRKKGGGGH